MVCFFSQKTEDTLPDVLCVGVPKAATTWLYNRLKLHSQVFLPKGKELHFFDESYFVKASNKIFEHEKNKLQWLFKFNMESRLHWKWYASQFKAGDENKVGIDITPTYCRVSKERIALIKDTLPKTKIILIIRNPIDRAWSGAAYFMDRFYGKSLDQLDILTLKNWVFDSERLDYGNYIDMIGSWDMHYKEDEEIRYIFYDDIKDNPRKILEEVCEFIDIDKELLPPSDQDRKTVNSNYKKTTIPDSIKTELQEIYKLQIDYLQKRFGRDLSHWVEG